MPSTVTVYYPFHPLVNHTLDVIQWPRRRGNAVTVLHPDGESMKVPMWMLDPEAARVSVSEQIVLSASALLTLVDLLSQPSSPRVEPEPHQETAHEANHLRIRRRATNAI